MAGVTMYKGFTDPILSIQWEICGGEVDLHRNPEAHH